MRNAYCVGARESGVVNCGKKMSSFLRFYLTKPNLGGIMGATEFGKPTDVADYAEPIKWVLLGMKQSQA